MKNQNAKKLNSQSVQLKQQNHQANIKNANIGQNGTNIIYDKNQGNRGLQLNPNRKQLKKGS